jgi:putative transposase
MDVIILAIELYQFRLDLHKASTAISKNHAIVCIEDLKVRNMSGSAAGSTDAPRRNVRNKSGLNKSILDQGWYEFRRQLDCKLAWNGGYLIAAPPQNTSRTCPAVTSPRTTGRRRPGSNAWIAVSRDTPMWSARSMC